MVYYTTISERFGDITFKVVFEDGTLIHLSLYAEDSVGRAYFIRANSMIPYAIKEQIVDAFAFAMQDRYYIYVDKVECALAFDNAFINETQEENEGFQDNTFLVRC